ncbi:MAG: putative chalcone synthase [Candidatus Roseilinea sp.]|nr:MAG: putative chalcone synthase [Candidatus Roseilinea sp.]
MAFGKTQDARRDTQRVTPDTAMSYILSVGTALPPHVVPQDEAATFALRHFEGRLARHGQLMSIFTNARIAKRHFVAPLEWFSVPHHGLKERNDLYICSAEALGAAAAWQALDRAGASPRDVDFIVFVSTTGLATPSIDARLIAKLGMRSTTKRLPVWGLGCAGGVAGLARAAEFVRAFPDKLALLVSVETCSITFQFDDFSKKNFVAAAIFADGAAAVVVGGSDWVRRVAPAGNATLQYVASHSHIFPNSEHVMGWDIVDTGLSVIFAPEIPARIARDMQPVVGDFLGECRLDLSDLSHYVLHPGGARVIEAYREAFALDEIALQSSSDVLCECGNMSSPTVLFVLERMLQTGRITPGQYALMGALGPGFSSELALLKGAVF